MQSRSRKRGVGPAAPRCILSSLQALALYLIAATAQLCAQEAPDFKDLLKESVRTLSSYLQIDTSNPPGRELRAAEYLAQVLRREGVPARVLKSAPGRGNVYARLKGRSDQGGLMLLSHLDVVPAEAASWTVPPFSGINRGGYIWGRGAVDAKGLGIAHLATMIALKRARIRLDRDVVFLATADEESGGSDGMAWIVRRHPEVLAGVDFALAEGGNNLVRDGHLAYVGVEHTQKIPVWLRLTCRGKSGHASVPSRGSAPHRLIRALERLLGYQPPVQINSAVSRYFRELAPFQSDGLRERYLDIKDAARNPDFLRNMEAGHRALLRTTISVTVARFGLKINSIPGQAVAELDCRLVPGSDPNEFLATVSDVIGDPNVEIEPLLVGESAASSLDSTFFAAIRSAVSRVERRAVVGPAVMPGFSDSRFLRERGIVAYGLDPFLSAAPVSETHANDEKLAVQELDFAIRFLWEIVSQFASS